MARDRRAFLWDIRQASAEIQIFTAGKTAKDYDSNAMLRAAVERKLEIIGEAINQATRYFPDFATKISEASKIVALRNRLIHGYALVSNALVWEIVQNDIPVLQREADVLLSDRDLS